VKRYSSGMYVRLAFAVAAHLEPEILIVDEVLAVGDAEFQKKCIGKMQDVSRSGRTVLFVSHNMGAVQSLCGVALLLDRGQLVRVGPVASVIREYLNGQRGVGGAVSQIHLGASLLLDGIHFAPREADHRAPISLRIRVVPKRPTTIRELALLLYSENGVRVSVLDLRRERLLPVALHGDPVEFEVGIDTPRLVEGDYSLGLHVATDEYQDNYLDLASFTVPSLQKRGDFIPYPAGQRGFVELEFSARVLEPGRARRVAS
jgi:lipopolysaccharide transport system ATP-binding protein